MGRQSARLLHNKKDHKDIFFNGHYHKQMWVTDKNANPTLVWEKFGGVELTHITSVIKRNNTYYVIGYYVYTSQGARYTRVVYAKGDNLDQLKTIWQIDSATGNLNGGTLTPTNTGMIIIPNLANDTTYGAKNAYFDQRYTADELRFLEIGDLDGYYGVLNASITQLIGTRWQTDRITSSGGYNYKEIGHDNEFVSRDTNATMLFPHTLGVFESTEARGSNNYVYGGYVQLIQDLSSSEYVVPSLFMSNSLKIDLFKKIEDKIIALGYEPIAESGSVISMHRKNGHYSCNTNYFIGSFYYMVEYKYIKNGAETTGSFAQIALLEMCDEAILNYKLYDSVEDMGALAGGTYYFRFSDVNVLTTVGLNWFYIGVGLDFYYLTNTYDGNAQTYSTLHEDGNEICYLFQVYDSELGRLVDNRAKINKYSHEKVIESFRVAVI